MSPRVRLFAGGILAAAVLISTSAAGALTLTEGGVALNIDRFDRSALADARALKDDYLAGHTVNNLHVETFEDYQAWNGTSGTADPKNTKVGSFRSTGATGTGHSVVGQAGVTQVRSDETMRWGRYNTDAVLGGHWLDSNDNKGIEWKISGLGSFNTVAFFLLDAADVGGKFSIKVGDTNFTDLAGGKRLANGNIQFVRIALDAAVDSLTLRLRHDRTNDGFGIDGAMIANLAPVPLPPAALLLIGGLAALGGLRYRRRTTA